MTKVPKVSQPDCRDGLRQAKRAAGPAWQPHFSIVLDLVPNLEQSLEWRAATDSPYYDQWKSSPEDVQRVRGAIANQIVRRLRDDDVRKLIEAGDAFWLELAKRVATCKQRWHQSGRIQASALRSLMRRYAMAGLSGEEKQNLGNSITIALLHKIDTGAGEEFRSLTGVARQVATPELIAALEGRVRDSASRSVRINAQRMLDRINGMPYKRYGES